GYHLFGIHETTGRLPSALAGLAAVLIAYELGRRLFSKGTALLAGVIAVSSPMLIGAARFANPDALLNATTALTLYLFWSAYERPRTWKFVAAGAAAGLAVLAKGPVGVVLPGAIVLLFLAWERRLQFLLDRRVSLTIVACLVVAIPWYAL